MTTPKRYPIRARAGRRFLSITDLPGSRVDLMPSLGARRGGRGGNAGGRGCRPFAGRLPIGGEPLTSCTRAWRSGSKRRTGHRRPAARGRRPPLAASLLAVTLTTLRDVPWNALTRASRPIRRRGGTRRSARAVRSGSRGWSPSNSPCAMRLTVGRHTVVQPDVDRFGDAPSCSTVVEFAPPALDVRLSALAVPTRRACCAACRR